MAKSRKTSRARAKRVGVSYAEKLAVLRKLSDGFDAKRWDRLKVTKPRTETGRQKKRAALSQVNRRYARVARFVNRDFKWVRPPNKRNFERLREYVGVPRFRGMRAIPLATQAKRVSVSFDRKGRPTIREDGVAQKLFLFPHRPKPRIVLLGRGKKKFLDAQDDAVAMLREMFPTMPQGFYIFVTRHHFLIPNIVERDRLEATVREFYSNYNTSPEFLAQFLGFKWLTDSDEDVFRIRKEMSSERERNKAIRKRTRIMKALKQVIAMDRAFKRGQLTKRARATGRR